jgi:exonuclease III
MDSLEYRRASVLETLTKLTFILRDLNCALNEIDIHSAKTNLKSAGFTIEERNSLKHYIEKLKHQNIMVNLI